MHADSKSGDGLFLNGTGRAACPVTERNATLAQFSAVVGPLRAAEVVTAACSELGLTATKLDQPQLLALLDRLSLEPGAVGIAARCIRVRAVLTFER